MGKLLERERERELLGLRSGGKQGECFGGKIASICAEICGGMTTKF